MNLSALATELAKPEYASMTDQEAADAINAKTVTVRRLVDTWRIKQYAIENGFWGKVRLAAENPTKDQIERELCIGLLDWVDDRGGNIKTVDMDLASVQTMLGGLVHFGYITETHAIELTAMANAPIRWVDSVGMGTIGDGHIRSVRGN
jgi:hypothetical protein